MISLCYLLAWYSGFLILQRNLAKTNDLSRSIYTSAIALAPELDHSYYLPSRCDFDHGEPFLSLPSKIELQRRIRSRDSRSLDGGGVLTPRYMISR